MLDASTVISKGFGWGPSITLSGPLPEVIVDGSTGGATTTVISGAAEAAAVDQNYVPGSWVGVAAGGTVSVGAGARRAIRNAGASSGCVLGPVTWS